MDESEKDTARALAACHAMIDGRQFQKEFGEVMVTLEHTIAAMLLTAFNGDRSRAAQLNAHLADRVLYRINLRQGQNDNG